MDNLLICYPKCSTCQKAKRWLISEEIPFTERDISLQNPTAQELTAWISASGLPARRFFNTSGKLYRELGLKDRLGEMSEEEMIALLSSDGMLVKRPIFLSGERVLVGFREGEWASLK